VPQSTYEFYRQVIPEIQLGWELKEGRYGKCRIGIEIGKEGEKVWTVGK